MLENCQSHPHPLAITMGEPAGVGGEVLLKTWANHRHSLPPFFVIDSFDRLSQIASKMGLDVPLYGQTSNNLSMPGYTDRLHVVDTPLMERSVPGQLNHENATSVVNSITKAVEMTMNGSAAGVVTNPIHKSALYEAGFAYPGHTEFLASLSTSNPTPVMMLACDQLRVVPVTIHVSLQDAVSSLTTENIIEQSMITAKSLVRDFGITNPHLAIAGLNPHASEAGAMGCEEQTIIQPAIDALKVNGIRVSGPHPPDTLFTAQARSTYDAAVCMYHDQALIPIKTLDFDGAVNVTLGLPFIRTSPDHGTALDIAGTGQASERSLVAAIRMAGTLVTNRSATNRNI
ncbi:MAG: 4-hydroxythreonine-4-phosphate dehydrogenase PdxA [Rhodospirillales bacterium]